MSFLNRAVLAGGKNLFKNLDARSFHVVTDSCGSELNQALALSLSEKGKSCNQMISSVTLFIFTVLQY